MYIHILYEYIKEEKKKSRGSAPVSACASSYVCVIGGTKATKKALCRPLSRGCHLRKRGSLLRQRAALRIKPLAPLHARDGENSLFLRIAKIGSDFLKG